MIMTEAILVLQLQGENFFQVEKFEISHFQVCISPKVIFSKNLSEKMQYHQRYSTDVKKHSCC